METTAVEQGIQSAVSTGETANTSTNQTADTAVAGGEFSAFFLKLLGKSDHEEVNEEELYSALIEKRLETLDPKAAEFYRTAKAEELTNFTRSDGYTYVEKASLAALSRCVEEGVITKEQGEQVNGEAFSAAQLDDNHDFLFDSRGSESDPTVAVGKMSETLFNLEQLLTKFENGESVAARPLVDPQPDSFQSAGVEEEEEESVDEVEGSEDSDDDTSLGDELSATIKDISDINDDAGVFGDGSELFTWKPASDKDGKVAVLIPASLSKVIDTVQLEDENGERHSGKADGKTKNGNRAVYRFENSANDYGSHARAVITTTDGRTVNVDVANTRETLSQSVKDDASA